MSNIHLAIYILIYCQLPQGIVSVKKEDYAEAYKPVTIGDTSYSMVELPGSETKVAVDERQKLLGYIDLRSFLHNLGHVGRCIQLAHQGMVAAGQRPDCVQLKKEVQGLGRDVIRLYAKSEDDVSKIMSETTTILTDLQATYEYLLDGSEDLALETLSSVSDIAGKFAKVAEELHNSFDKKAHIVERIQEKTQETEADKEHIAEKGEVDLKDHEIIKERVAHEYRKAEKESKRAEQNFLASELEEKKAFNNLKYNEAGVIQRVIEIAIGSDHNPESRKKQHQAKKEKMMEAEKIHLEKEEKEDQAYQRMAEKLVELQHYESEVESAKSSADVLHKAIGGLKTLTATMMQAAVFWKRMQNYCTLLSDNKLKDTVAKEIRDHSVEQRLKLWISMPFKKRVVSFIAGWVALDGVCNEYYESFTQNDLFKYIRENPTQKEAQKNVPSLATKFQKDTNKKACAKEDSECSRK